MFSAPSSSVKRARKRRRFRVNKTAQEESLIDDGVPSTIRALMGPDAVILPLFDFVRQCAPNLRDLAPLEDTPDNLRLQNTLVCPSHSMAPSGCRRVECIQSLSSLVDDVIWSLVQRRSRDKTRNVLSQGYVLASEHLLQTHGVRPCPHMRPGVLCTHMNDNVSFCKTSSLAQTLHRLVGDDVLRALLLHTSVFLPVEQDWDNPKQNYLLLCGPPVQATRTTVLGRKRAPAASSVDGRAGRRRKSPKISDETKTRPACKDYKWHPNAVVPRQSLFYSGSFVPKVGLPSTHLLNQRPENCQTLLASMFDCNGNKGRKRWRRVCELGISVCEQIFRRHAKCDYHRLLNRYCPLPEFCSSDGDVPATCASPAATLAQVSVSHSPSDGIVSFLRAVLLRVFPPEFWGSEHNFDKALDVAETFVKLRRQEQLPNKALTHGIRVKDVLWVYGGTESSTNNESRTKQTWSKTLHEAATTRMRNVMKWLFSRYLIPLLRSVFYITESEFSAKRVLYYRKPVWSMFRSLSIKKLMVRQYFEISRNDAEALVKSQRMGFSRLRLLPKKTGVRALATLSKREYADFEKIDRADMGFHESDVDMPAKKRAKLNADESNEIMKQASNRRLRLDKMFCSTNAILSNVFEVLRYERERQPHLFGAGVFGINEVYPEYRRFLAKFRQFRATSVSQPNSPQLYFASVDIKQCYDSINQKHLLNILPKLISQDDYLIQNYVVMHPFESMGRVLRKKINRIGPPEAYRPFHGAADVLTREYNRSVFMDGLGCSLVRRVDVMELLEEHLLSHVVVVQGRYGDRFLLQSTGIPQGSVLSTLLCNYYYGHVEKALLGDIARKAANGGVCHGSCPAKIDDGHVTLLVRIVDDFLLITTNRELSTKFLATMRAGDDKLGVHINNDKTLANCNVQGKESDGEKEKLECGVGGINEADKTQFPWCGMLFDSESGEVSIDYSRFADGRATDALTVDRSGEEGRQLEIRMKSFVRPRCQPILFDSRINSARVVGINFMQVLLLCAVKTVSYIVDGMEGGVEKNPEYIVRSIDDVCLYTHTLIAERLRQGKKSLTSNASSSRPLFKLKQRDAMWLGWNAFRSMFNLASGCGGVVSLLTEKCTLRIGDIRDLRDIADAALRQFNSQLGYNLE